MTAEPTDELTLETCSTLLQETYSAGDKAALLRMIMYCVRNLWPIPDWTRCALDEIYENAQAGNIRSWDDVFGRPWSGGQRRGAQTRSRKWEVWCTIHDIVEEEECPIDNELFERAGKKLGIARSTVANLYGEVQRAWRRIHDNPTPTPKLP